MGKIRDGFNLIGELANAYAANERKVNDMADQLQKRTLGLERKDAMDVARVLVSQATVTWKN